MTFSEGNIVYPNKEAFLWNNENKKQFVGLLTKYLHEENRRAINCHEDMNTKITLESIGLALGKRQLR